MKVEIVSQKRLNDLKEIPNLLTRRELSRAMNVSMMTIYTYSKKAGLPFLKLSSGVIRYEPQKVYEWWQEQTQKILQEIH